MKLELETLVIEVTRRCNMHCAHCMRGDAENHDLNLDKIAEFLANVESIGSITFTGGEPTLNVNAINFILHMCRSLQIPVCDFYIVTNGKKVTAQFLKSMIDWYAYCIECGGEPDLCGVALSQDDYHEPIKSENIAKLRALSFYNNTDKRVIWKNSSLIDLGRARGIVSNPKRDPMYSAPEVTIDRDIIRVSDGVITFTVDGEILLDCDYEYESTDDIKACDYNDVIHTFTRMANDPTYIWPI